MSYTTYTTDALVCGTFDRLTSDRTYLLFTDVAGMVFATARSAREERSKQRYALQDFSHVRVSLVKGKGGWRIGSVEPLQNYYVAAPNRAARGSTVAVVQLLRRVVTGEESHPKIFSDTVAVLTAIIGGTGTVENQLELFTLRTLAHLGYIAQEPAFSEILASGDAWCTSEAALPSRVKAAIERGLAASHL